MAPRPTPGPLPVLVTLGADAEQAAHELLLAACDGAPCDGATAEMRRLYREGAAGHHRDCVRAVAALPDDMSALPANVAACLSGLKSMGAWSPEQVKPRILQRCPLVADAAHALDCMNRVETIRRFTEQAQAERLLNALSDALLYVGTTHPETVERCRTLMAALEPSPVLDFERAPTLEPVM